MKSETPNQVPWDAGTESRLVVSGDNETGVRGVLDQNSLDSSTTHVANIEEGGKSSPVDKKESKKMVVFEPGQSVEVQSISLLGEDRGNRAQEQYQIVKKLGEGGMGAVFLVTRENGQEVAVKIMTASDVKDLAVRDRFLREVATHTVSSDLSPYVLPILDFVEISIPGSSEKKIGMVMQYMKDGSVEDLFKKISHNAELKKPENYESLVATMFEKMVKTVNVLHRHGIAHRDLKPANMFVDLSSSTIKLGDFGIAKKNLVDQVGDDTTISNKPAGAEELAMNKITRQGLLAGTPQYLSPETIRGIGDMFENDLYALGVIMYNFRTGGNFPFDTTGKNLSEVLEQRMKEAPRTVQEILKEDYTPSIFDPIIEALVSRDASQRKKVIIDSEEYEIDTAENLLKTIHTLMKKNDIKPISQDLFQNEEERKNKEKQVAPTSFEEVVNVLGLLRDSGEKSVYIDGVRYKIGTHEDLSVTMQAMIEKNKISPVSASSIHGSWDMSFFDRVGRGVKRFFRSAS